MRRHILISAAVTLVAAAIVPAQPETRALDPVAIEREARVIDASLIAPCCFTQQVSVHQSPAADEVRRDVRARLAAGQSRDEIVAAYVARYGKRILAEPPAAGFDLTLYVVPFLLLIVTVALVAIAIHRVAHAAAGQIPSETVLPTEDENARLDDELRDLD